MMKKTASALAIAALMGTGAASAATFQISDDTTLSIFGDVQVAYQYTDVRQGDGSVSSEGDFFDNGTGIGFAGEHVFDNGLTGFVKVDLDGYDAVDGGTGGVTDEAYLGVMGGFGSIQFGRDDSIYDKTIDSYWGFHEVLAGTRPGGDTNNRSAQYFSPNFGGFSFAVEGVFTADNDHPLGQDADGDPAQDVNGDDAPGVSLAAAATYQVGNLTLEGAVDQRGETLLNDDNYADNPLYGVVASYDFGQFTLDGGYQLDSREDDEGGDRDILSLQGRFDYGMGLLYLTVQEVMHAEDDIDDATEVFGGVIYDIGANMYVYAEFGRFDAADDVGDGYAVGAYYSF